MRYTLAHGTGNDFVVLPDLDDAFDPSPALVRALCHRRLGLGADGILRIGGPRDGAPLFMDYRNADGSIVEMCGNGVRVVAAFAVRHGLVEPGTDHLAIATRAGVREVDLHRDRDGRVTAVTVDMGPPRTAPADVPFLIDSDERPSYVIGVSDTTVEVSVVSMGNPHAVTIVDDIGTAAVHSIGPRLEAHPAFPKGVNVEFVELRGRGHAALRVWERGVGETASCGTGACATLVALQARGEADGELELTVAGGTLSVRHHPDEHPSVFLTGPAVEVASGELDEAWLRAAAAGEFDPDAVTAPDLEVLP